MATSSDAYIPSQIALTAVIEQVLRPHVESLVKQGFPGLEATLSIWKSGECVASSSVTLPDQGKEFVPAEIRCEFRRTFNPERSLFMMQAMLEEPLPKSGFSGFKIKGELGEAFASCVAKPTGVVGHYNVQAWSRW